MVILFQDYVTTNKCFPCHGELDMFKKSPNVQNAELYVCIGVFENLRRDFYRPHCNPRVS